MIPLYLVPIIAFVVFATIALKLYPAVRGKGQAHDLVPTHVADTVWTSPKLSQGWLSKKIYYGPLDFEHALPSVDQQKEMLCLPLYTNFCRTR